MRMRARNWTSLLVAALLGSLLALGACSGDQRTEPTPDLDAAVSEPLPDQELFGTTTTDSRDGVRRWTLRSDTLMRYLDQDEAQLYGVHMEFFRADTLFSTLTSRRGRANQKTNDLFVWGNVVVVTPDGRRLETAELKYDNATNRISNDVFNRLTRDDDVLTGVGMVATPDLGYFELRREVDASVNRDDAGDGRP